MGSEEAGLIDRLARRDRSAIEQVVRAHHSFLVGMVVPLVGMELAEDVVQEAWIKALTAVSRFEGRARLRTWLAQIALNTARSRRRAGSREVYLEEWGRYSGEPLAYSRGGYGQREEPIGARTY